MLPAHLPPRRLSRCPCHDTAGGIVVSPLTASAAKTINDKQVSPPPVAWITMTGVSTTPAMQSAACWKPRPKEGACCGFS